jgi:hypothetical protein
MRFSGTIEHSHRLDAWREAYAKHDEFAEAGDDGLAAGGTEAADKAGDVELATLDALLFAPSVTTIEMQDKIKVMRDRGPLREDNLCWNEKDMTRILDQMERDLVQLHRPSCSPRMAEAFKDWAEAQACFYSEREIQDDELGKRGDAVTAARATLSALPCTTAGDFIAKAFVDLVNEVGATFPEEAGGPFMPDMTGAHPQDQRVYSDIRESDLGCCMIALGRVDFDAARWVTVARLHRKGVNVMLTDRGRRLSLSMEGPHTEMDDLLQRLTANGLRQISSARCVAIADEIEANHPDLVIDCRDAIAA